VDREEGRKVGGKGGMKEGRRKKMRTEFFYVLYLTL